MTRLTDEQIESYAIRLTNARRHGMSEQALLVIAEELLSEVRAARASPPPSRAPESDAEARLAAFVRRYAAESVRLSMSYDSWCLMTTPRDWDVVEVEVRILPASGAPDGSREG